MVTGGHQPQAGAGLHRRDGDHRTDHADDHDDDIVGAADIGAIVVIMLMKLPAPTITFTIVPHSLTRASYRAGSSPIFFVYKGKVTAGR